jgi:regulator of sigma E protease
MSVVLFLLILLVLILVHEFGHFLAAKWAGIRVNEFGVGFPPRLFGKKFGETLYSVNALPLGGFVKIFGEDPDAASISGPDRERSFVNKPRLVQAGVLVAGVLGNLLLAWLLLSLGFMIGMPTALQDAGAYELEDVRLIATSVLPSSPAAKAGMKAGDQILRIEAGRVGENTETPEDISSFIAAHGGEEVRLYLTRDNRPEQVTVRPEAGVISGEPETPAIGISMGQVGTLTLPLHRALYEGAIRTYNLFIATVVGITSFLVGAIRGVGDFSQIAGPVGIISLVGDASALGLVYLLSFTALISINLTIINLLPFPSLDGGRLLFVIIEAIKGSAIRPAVANTLNAVGFVLLILLMIAVTYNDIVRLATS